MLEVGSVLATYRLQLPPEELLQQTTTAVKIFDHPLRFLTYEGSVNNDKGSVRIAEAGTYQLLNQTSESYQLQLDGKILKGKFTLTHIEANKWKFARDQNK